MDSIGLRVELKRCESLERVLPRMRRIARSITTSPETADEVVQDAILRLLTEVDAAKLHCAEAYLGRMVRNLAIDRRRRAGVEQRLFHADGETDCLSCPLAGSNGPETQMKNCQLLVAIEQALEALPNRVSQAFVRHRIGGEAQKDIAQTMDISRALVCDFVKRADTACREALAARE